MKKYKQKKEKTEWRDGTEWVIYSKSKKAIWSGGSRLSFLSYQDAKWEYDKQMAMLTPEIRENVDWKIEERHWGAEIFTNAEDVDESFGAFD